MTENLTPEQLPAPSTNARKGFIAYGKPTRLAVPTADGTSEPTTVRPQVFVRYLHDIAVKEVKHGGRSGKADTITVEFDPESIGYTESVVGYLDPDDPIADYLEQKRQTDATVTVGIEIARRVKKKGTKEPISPLPHIHALRGAEHPDGSGATMAASGENTSKTIALVDGRRTRKVSSDPAEWAMLVNNTAGDLPPEGWSYYCPGNDWTQISTIVPTEHESPKTDDASLNADTLTALIEKAVEKAVANTLDDTSSGAAATNGRPLGRRFNEGKPWDVRTNDGRINLGGYGVLAEGYVFRWAHTYLTEHADEVTDEGTWALTSAVLEITDRVQTTAYGAAGSAVLADRTINSHTEASRWVLWTISTVHPYDANQDLEQWADHVTAVASEHFARCGSRLDEFLQQRAAQERHQKSDAQQADTQVTPEGPPPAVHALLSAIAKGWDNADTIKTLGSQLKDRQDLNVSVIATHHDDGNVTLNPGTGHGAQVLRDVLLERHSALKNSAPAEGNPPPPPPAATRQEPAADQLTGYADDVAVTMQKIAAVQTRQDAEEAYNHAKAANHLNDQVAVKVLDNGTVAFGSAGADGYDTRTVAAVLDYLTRQIEAAADDPPAPQSGSAEGTPSAQQIVDGITRKRAELTLTADDIDEALNSLHKSGRSSDTVTAENAQGSAAAYLNHLRKASMAGASA